MTESVPLRVLYPGPSPGAHSPLLTPSDFDDFECIPNQSASSYNENQVDISNPEPIPKWIRHRVVSSNKYKALQVKYGTDELLVVGGLTMLYVAQSTKIPVPKIHAIYSRKLVGGLVITYIVIQSVPGQTLEELWPSMDEAGKSAIAKELRTYFHELRQLKQKDYLAFFIKMGVPLNVNVPLPNLDFLSELIKWKQAPNVLCGQCDRVFTHSALSRKNVIVQPNRKTLVLINWDLACWRPRCAELEVATWKHPDDEIPDDDWKK